MKELIWHNRGSEKKHKLKRKTFDFNFSSRDNKKKVNKQCIQKKDKLRMLISKGSQ